MPCFWVSSRRAFHRKLGTLMAGAPILRNRTGRDKTNRGNLQLQIRGQNVECPSNSTSWQVLPAMWSDVAAIVGPKPEGGDPFAGPAMSEKDCGSG